MKYSNDDDAWAFPKEIFVEVDSVELQDKIKDSTELRHTNMEIVGEAPTNMETKFILQYVSKADLVEQIQDLTGKTIKCNLFTTQAQLEQRAILEMSNKTELEVVCVYR